MGKKIKVLHLISSLKLGGAESWIVQMAAELKKKGCDQVVYYFHSGPNVQKISQMGIVVSMISGWFLRYDFVFWWRLFWYIRKESPDIIHSSLWMANFAGRVIARILDIPIICTIHGKVNQDGALRNRIDRGSFQFADTIVSVSDDVRKSLDQFKFPTDEVLSLTIQNGINVKQFSMERSDNIRKQLQIDSSNFIIGAVGRFVPVKNFGFLLDVFADFIQLHPLSKLLLIGSGPLENDLRNKVNVLGIADSVTFVVDSDAYPYYSVMDCFVLPSLQEGISIALLEAMASGLACIVTHENYKHEIILNNDNGFCIPLNAKEELIDTLQRLRQNKDLRISIGKRAREFVFTFHGIKKMTQQYYSIYKQLIFKEKQTSNI